MSRDQTIYSELAVAIAINGGSIDGVINIDKKSKSAYRIELSRRNKSIAGKARTQSLISAGTLIKDHLAKKGIAKPVVEWAGSDKLSAGSPVAKDIFISNANLRISIKENADVYINGSPERVFQLIPSGFFGHSTRGDDWFFSTAQIELDCYFLACGGNRIKGCKNTRDFYSLVERKQRKVFGKKVKALHDSNNSNVIKAYAILCEKVSNESAKIFNANLTSSLTDKNKVLPGIFKFFFRLNSVEYILAGVEKNKPFAVSLMPVDQWIKKYDFVDVIALPLQKGQPEVLLRFSFKDKKSKTSYCFDARVEIRWSHGKFCGNPEAKVYKTWNYADLPWVSLV
jgi:hypothetical protein